MSKCWYCNNELTTGDNPKHFGICNKCYDEMFKSDDTIIRSFTNKISDLEVKLKESESKRKSIEEKVKFLTEEIEECFVDGQKYNELREQKDKEIQELKQQLAEKEKEIEYQESMKILAVKNQNQKAIEQLEKVKTQCEFSISFACDEQEQRLYDFIDQQINELKGKVEDVKD